MARMYPPEPREDTQSSAERELFRVLRDQLSDKWIVLHSLGVAAHPTKLWAEIDFVLIGPPGVFCLEVKGGRIRRENGLWHFINRHGEVTVKRQGPFEQVAPAAASLGVMLRQKLPRLSNAAVGFGVVTPDIPFDIPGPDLVREVVYDEADTERPFGAYLRRLTDYWHSDLERRRGTTPDELREEDRQDLLRELRGDFDLRPSMRRRIGMANEELLRLTDAQYAVLDGLADNPRVLVRGGAGTGKTLLAVEEARRRAQRGEKVLLCCYNKHLGAHIQATVRDVPGIHAQHLHGFMAAVTREAGLQPGENAPAQRLFEEVYPSLTLDALDKLGRLESYDALIVDEAQDLMQQAYLDVFDVLLKGNLAGGVWKLFYDPYQDLFRGTEPEALRKLESYAPAFYRLPTNCRNTKPIALMTQILTGISFSEMLRAEGPDVKITPCRDKSHERREVSKEITRLLSEGVEPESIVILSHLRRDNGALKPGLENVSCPLIDFESGGKAAMKAVRYATIQSFKGLEADVVLVVDVDDLTTPEAEMSLYVGASRARAVLQLFITERLVSEYAKRAEDYGRRLGAA